MIKLKVGEYYKTRDGRSVGPMRKFDEDSFDSAGHIDCDELGGLWREDGLRYYKESRGATDIVSLWHEPETPEVGKGVKHDSGKIIAGVLFEEFPRALIGLCEVATFGAEKYSRNDWQHVEDAHRRYSDAMVRHMLAKGSGEINDPETGLPHVFHIAWNALAIAELEAKEKVNV